MGEVGQRGAVHVPVAQLLALLGQLAVLDLNTIIKTAPPVECYTVPRNNGCFKTRCRVVANRAQPSKSESAAVDVHPLKVPWVVDARESQRKLRIDAGTTYRAIPAL